MITFFTKIKGYLFLSTIFLSFASCQSSFLDVKPSLGIDLLEDLQDLENLLENVYVLNQTGSLKQAASDEYYILTKRDWEALKKETYRNVYVWDADTYGGEPNQPDWNGQYKAVFYANAVLDRLSEIATGEDAGRENYIKGTALLYRAYAYADMAVTFCPLYDPEDEGIGQGLPLRTSADIDKVERRSSVKETHDFIIRDLKEALVLLQGKPFPINYPTRASAEAVYAVLARLYLNMRDYPSASFYADQCLKSYAKLVDYNDVCRDCFSPFEKNLSEVVFYSTIYTNIAVLTQLGELEFRAIDTTLVKSYLSHDLRLPVMYMRSDAGHYYKKAGYIKLGYYDFTGLATDEVYLIRAEGYAREGKYDLALADLNTLLKTRFELGFFKPIDNYPNDKVLDLILEERRKSLVWRGLRWADLKRLNKEGRNITLYRNLDGTKYQLEPNSPRYIFPIPDDEKSISLIN